ncbi:MAG: MBL fold metallo-hydrolase [Patescibacteria group bacterium]|nr:MBL fold metallo-hydrolase [Patescibacteria group bacterium]
MSNNENKIIIDPIFHASLILEWNGVVIYADPIDEDKKNIYAGKPAPDIILITDIHHDHLDIEVLKKITLEKTILIVPKVVADQISPEISSKIYILNNDETMEHMGFKIEAIPMYNLPGPSESYHIKGRGNGYVIEQGGTRVYISGDTAGIPEMRNLKNIDTAFVAMNLPYTMDPQEAASAVLDFKPKTVYPYHYRQHPTNDFSDVAKFKEKVNSQNPEIKVVQVDWYHKN